MFKNKLFFFALLCITIVPTALCENASEDPIQTHTLKPPILEEENWGEPILCHRPVRRGGPRMEIEQIDQKIIAHNYGHGGGGWALAPGCARHIVRLFEEKIPDGHNRKIEIIGAGVIGLFMAYELVHRGYSNITIVAEQFEDLTSHKAGGLWAPFSMDLDQERRSIMHEICLDSYRFYAQIARGEDRYFPNTGATLLPLYLKRQDNAFEIYEDIIMRKPQNVIVDFNNGKIHEMKVYEDGLFIDTGAMMNALTIFLHDKVQWVKKRITSLDELDASYIFNCAGLGARYINHDEAMVSVQGHLVLLKNQNPEDMNYMIFFQVDETRSESGKSMKRYLYMLPKHMPGSHKQNVGVLGGTVIEGATKSKPHGKEFDLIIDRANSFFGA